MITWHIQALINRRWQWVRIITDTGNKWQACEEYKAQQAKQGVKVGGFGMNHAYMQYN